MKTSVYFVLILLQYVLLSCQKETGVQPAFSEEYTLSGYILDEVTSAPISGAEVFILEKEGGILVQTPDKQIAFTKTDGKGYYEIKFPVRAAGYLYLFQARAQHKNYFTKPNPERITIAKSGQSKFDWKLEPPAFVNLLFQGSGNSLLLDYSTSTSLGNSNISSNQDTSFIQLAKTIEDFVIHTWVYRGQDLLYQKSYNLGKLSPFDTTSYTINF